MYKLRELERKDIPAINKWRSSSELISYLGAPYRFINSEVDEKWFESYMSNRNSTVRCSIVDVSEKEEKLIGLITLASINHINQSATLHIMIGENENQGKGAGMFAIKEMLNHAFMNLNLHRVDLTVLENNTRAQHLYEKCGFIKEGILKEAIYKNGKFINMYCYAILKNEFKYNSEGQK